MSCSDVIIYVYSNSTCIVPYCSDNVLIVVIASNHIASNC